MENRRTSICDEPWKLFFFLFSFSLIVFVVYHDFDGARSVDRFVEYIYVYILTEWCVQEQAKFRKHTTGFAVVAARQVCVHGIPVLIDLYIWTLWL